MNGNTKLDQLEMLALTKLGMEVNRKKVKPGTYPINFNVNVSGMVTVGEDYDRAATVKISTYGLVVLALQKAGIKDEEKILAIIERAADKAVQLGEKFEDGLSKKAQKRIAAIKERFAETLPKTPCDGPVSVDLTVNKITATVTEVVAIQ